MSSLLPFLQDLLPMIIPTPIHITRASDLEQAPAPVAEPVTEPKEVKTEEEGPGQASAETNGHMEPQINESRPAVTSRNAIVGKTDKMCAAGEHASYRT